MQKSEIKAKIKDINGQLEALLWDDRRIKSSSYEQWVKDLLLEMNDTGIGDWPWAKLMDWPNRKSLLRQRDLLEDKPLPQGTIGVREIELAKHIPIEQLIEFNRAGFAKCLWHEPDKNPSMKWFKKNNKVKCFSCGYVGDTLDVTMKLYNISLPQAVKRLLNVWN